MSDTALNLVIQYGPQADRIAFTPDPAVGSKVLYIWYEDDNAPDTYIWDGSNWVQINSSAIAINQLTGDVTAGPGSGSVAATIANNAVTNAKLADVSTQTIKGRVAGGAGDPTDLTATQATSILDVVVGDSGAGGVKGLAPAPAAGDAAAGKFLKADGTYAVPPGSGAGSGLVLLSEQIASGGASLDFTSVITSLYDEYLLEVVNLVPATDGGVLWLRISSDNGATWKNSNYSWIEYVVNTTASLGNFGSSSDAKIQLTGDVDSDGITPANGFLRIFNPLSTVSEFACQGQFNYMQRFNGLRTKVEIAGWHNTAADATDAIQLLFDTGNVASGVARLYGLAKV